MVGYLCIGSFSRRHFVVYCSACPAQIEPLINDMAFKPIFTFTHRTLYIKRLDIQLFRGSLPPSCRTILPTVPSRQRGVNFRPGVVREPAKQTMIAV